MIYILVYIIGILHAILIFVVLGYFRAGIEKRIKIIENHLGELGPKPKGAIFIPDDEDVAARKEVIKKNKAMGKNTHITDLQS